MSVQPRDLVILKAIAAHLKGITIDNGYSFDLGESVWRGVGLYGDELTLPALSILESPRLLEPTAISTDPERLREEDWNLIVQGWVDDDPANPTDPAYLLKAVVEDRLSQITATNQATGDGAFPLVFNLGGGIVEMQIGPASVSPPRRDISPKAFFLLSVKVCRVFDATDVFISAPSETIDVKWDADAGLLWADGSPVVWE